MWRAYYRKWECATQSILDIALLELVPALAQFAPPAKIIDRPVLFCLRDRRAPCLAEGKAVDTLIRDRCLRASTLAAVDFGYRVIA
jgi:hypothetical protein